MLDVLKDREYRLSVIVPIYNGAKFINDLERNFIELYDECDSCEFIFIDDGSKDNSWELLSEVQKELTNCRIYHKENGGIADARNYGLKRAIGKYILFIDQDDSFNAEALLYNLSLIETKNWDMLSSNYYIERNGKKNKNNIISTECEISGIDLKAIADDFLTTHCKPCPEIYQKYNFSRISTSIWNCLFKRQFLIDNKISFFKFVDYEDDYLFLINCLYAANKIILSDVAYYTWRILNTSESHKGKYIPDFKERRLKLNQWMYDKAKQEGIQGKELFLFKCWHYTSMVYRGYRSICSKQNRSGFFQKRKQLKDLAKTKDKGVKLLSYSSEISNKIILLLKLRLYSILILLDSIRKKIHK